MAVVKVPVKFETSDGREFDTKKEAERHEAVVTAARQFNEAKHRLGRVLAEREKTADGQTFDFATWSDYYHITHGWAGLPALSTVSFYVWNCEFDVDGQEHVIIRQRTQTGRMSSDERTVEYRICNLYADKRAAYKALLKAQEEWLKERAEQVAELRAEVTGAGRGDSNDSPPLGSDSSK